MITRYVGLAAIVVCAAGCAIEVEEASTRDEGTLDLAPTTALYPSGTYSSGPNAVGGGAAMSGMRLQQPARELLDDWEMGGEQTADQTDEFVSHNGAACHTGECGAGMGLNSVTNLFLTFDPPLQEGKLVVQSPAPSWSVDTRYSVNSWVASISADANCASYSGPARFFRTDNVSDGQAPSDESEYGADGTSSLNLPIPAGGIQCIRIWHRAHTWSSYGGAKPPAWVKERPRTISNVWVEDGRQGWGDQPPGRCGDADSADAGDPVNVLTGTFHHHEVDHAATTRGLPLGFTRRYHSARAAEEWSGSCSGPLGCGWHHEWMMALHDPAPEHPDWVRIDGPMGERLFFKEDGSGYRAGPGTQGRLVKSGSEYVLTLGCSGRKARFDSAGRLKWFQDRQGSSTRLTIERDGANRVQHIVEPTPGGSAPQRRIRLVYNGSGRLTQSVFETTSGSQLRAPVTYQYDGSGRLTRVTDYHGAEVQYDYSGGRIVRMHLPRTPGDSSRKVLHNDYNAQGRVYRQREVPSSGATRTTLFTRYQEDGTLAEADDEIVAYVEVRAPNNQTTEYHYARNGTLVAIKDPLGNGEYRDIDPATYRLRGVHPNVGPATTFEYGDTRVLPTRVTLGGSRSISMAYNGEGLLTQITDPAGTLTRLTYTSDSSGRVVHVDEAVGTNLQRRLTTRYNSFGRVRRTTDPLGRSTDITYDNYGRVASRIVHRPDGPDVTESQTFDRAGRLLTRVDRLGTTTTFGYDAADDYISTVTEATGTADERTTRVEIGPQGAPIWMEDPLGNQVDFEYTDFGELERVIGALGSEVEYEYNNMGAVTKVVQDPGPSEAVTQITYDNAGRPRTITDPTGVVAERRYDGAGRVTEMRDAAGRGPRFSYNGVGDLATTTVEGSETQYEYDKSGRLKRVIDAQATPIMYRYDVLGRLIEVRKNALYRVYLPIIIGADTELPLEQRWAYEYDAANRLTSVTNPDGDAIGIGYNGLDQLISVNFPAGMTDLSYGYDVAGRRRSMTDALGSVTYEYDRLHRLTSEVRGSSRLDYEYDDRDLRTLTYPSGLSVDYEWDDEGRLDRVNAPGLLNYDYTTYDGAGRLRAARNLTHGIDLDLGYDGAGRLNDLAYSVGATDIARFDGANFNARGLQTSARERFGSTVYNYTYETDNQGQLTRATRTGGGLGTHAWNYAYDEVGNRLSLQASGSELGMPAGTYASQYQRHQLTSIDGPGGNDRSFTHDNLGTRSENGITTQYDALGRMTRHAGTTFVYDGNGRLAREIRGSTTTNLRWDPLSRNPRLLERGGQAYVHGHALLAKVEGGSATPFALDGRGTPRLLGTNADNHDLYSPFGRRLRGASGGHRFRYGGAYAPAGMEDMLSMGARFYQPSTGTFATTDPVAGVATIPLSLHPYQYGFNNPNQFSDPTGEFPHLLLLMAGGAVIGGILGGVIHAAMNDWEFGGKGFWAAVAGGAVAGAVAPLAAALLPEALGLGALIGAEFLAGAAGGAATQAVLNWYNCVPLLDGLLGAALTDGLISVLTFGLFRGAGRFLRRGMRKVSVNMLRNAPSATGLQLVTLSTTTDPPPFLLDIDPTMTSSTHELVISWMGDTVTFWSRDIRPGRPIPYHLFRGSLPTDEADAMLRAVMDSTTSPDKLGWAIEEALWPYNPYSGLDNGGHHGWGSWGN